MCNCQWTLSTLVKNCKTKVVVDLLNKSKTVCKTVVPQIVAKSVAKFEKSSTNFLRSVSVLYKGGILSKRKYCNLRSSQPRSESAQSLKRIVDYLHLYLTKS